MSQVFGAYDGDDMVGAVTIEFSEKFKTRHKAHLLGMFVKASARGQGIGKALLTSALSAAKDRPGVLVVMLTVTEGNHSASALYESCGFKAFGIEPMAVATTDGYHAKVHMWHRLP
jgi:ribosomal protein S18 acetylase RimI-like enzyme